MVWLCLTPMIKWAGNFRLVFGRSKTGVDYLATGSKLHLIVLLVAGKGRVRMHLEVLAAVAELLNDKEFRKDLSEHGMFVTSNSYSWKEPHSSHYIDRRRRRYRVEASPLSATLWDWPSHCLLRQSYSPWTMIKAFRGNH